MILTPEEARDIIYGDHPDWETIEEEIIGNRRWSIINEGIFLHKPSGEYYQFNWSKGATEYQDEQPFEYDKEVKPQKVIQIKKMVEVTEWVEDNMEV